MKILHTADLHLRDRQYARAFRGADFRAAMHRMIDLAVDQQVDAIINGGDTFQINRPGSRLQAVLMEAHGRLKKAGIPMLCITGNHDNADPSFLEFPALTDYFEALTGMPEPDQLNEFRRNRKLEGATGIVCIDNARVRLGNWTIAGFPASVDSQEMLKLLAAEPADIVVWHGCVAEFVPFPSANSLALEDMALPGIRAWLLGDIHLRNRKRTKSGVLVSYPGTLELCEKGEPAEKFVDIYTLPPEPSEFPEPQEVPMVTRPVLFLSVSDDNEADQACTKIQRTLLDNPGTGPLVFLSYDQHMRDVVGRINGLLDPKNSVFLSATFKSKFKSAPGKQETLGKPELAEVVAEVVPPNTDLHQVCLELARRDTNARQSLAEWVDKQLTAIGYETNANAANA